MEALKKQGHAPVLKAMVWQQGEGDARDIAGIKNALSYGANLNNLIKRIRADLEAPGLAFIYGSVLPVPAPARFPGREKVRQGQKDVAEESRTSLSVNNALYVPADDLQLRSMDFRTPIHGYRPSGHAWSSSPGRTLCLRIGKALETKKTRHPCSFFLPHFLQPHPENQ